MLDEEKLLNLKSVIKKALMVVLTVVLLLAFAFGGYCLSVFGGGVSVNINDSITFQTFEGFGASSCWTFQQLGAIDDEKTKTDAIEMLYGDSGLQLDIFRYNIGGGSAEAKFDDVSPYNNGWFSDARRSQSFFMADKFQDASSFADAANYDFSKDAATFELFKAALATGNVNEIVLFANSPHYLMTESGKTTGEYEYQNNLKPEYYEAFADYLLVIANGIYDNLIKDMAVKPKIYISPINEPQWKWGGSEASQEGCHYDPENLAAFLDVFYKKVKAFNTANGTSFIVDAFESGNYKINYKHPNSADYLKAMSKYDYFSEIKQISVHSYGAETDVGHRERFMSYLNKNYSDVSVSMSEICEMVAGRDTSIDSGIWCGKVISRDLTILNANSWSWWLAVSDGDYNDGLVYWDHDEDFSNSRLSVLKRYYALGQYSRFLDRGDVRILSTHSDFLGVGKLDISAFKKADGSTVVIIINDGATQKIKLKGNYSTMQTTVTSADKNWETSDETGFFNKLTLDKKSITTIVLK